ncbi:MAG TPA: TraB/GumN family protein [Asticcacaulis sp.]|nr:TraB/GumN family protein [Asticcacaulis sp.]
MISRLKTGLLAAVLFVSAFMPMAAPAKAPDVAVKPAMWVIRDSDSTLYLLGSIHVMKPDTVWLTPGIQTRFDSAEDVWFEIPDLDDKAAAGPLAAKYMVDPAGRMTDGLTPEEIARIDALLKPMGLSTLAASTLRKWAVGLLITLEQVKAQGYTTETGVDVTLLGQARAGQKRVHGFETMDSQMQALVPETEADELTALRTTLKDVETMPQDLEDLFVAWKQGDIAALTHLMIDKMQAEDPKSYQRLIVERNAAWAPQIETVLAGKGTVFITVGAGHLVGPDSVIAMLEQQGIMAERLPD